MRVFYNFFRSPLKIISLNSNFIYCTRSTTINYSKMQKPIVEDFVKKYKRKEVEDLLKRKFIVIPSFEIYGGVAGLYDLGPVGCALKNNIINQWRNHFILEEEMVEFSGSSLTPLPVFKASGHLDKFTDAMVKDKVTGVCYRADKYLKEKGKAKPEEIAEYQKIIEDCEEYDNEQLSSVFHKYNIKSDSGNPFGEPEDFFLMFGCQIGPTGKYQGFLRPETAQGIFVNFKRMLDFNMCRMPFGAAQIGPAFRNEISPRGGLMRLREFTIAEIEHFCDPTDKSHKKFINIKSLELPLLSKSMQESGTGVASVSLERAVNEHIIIHETLGYFMGRTYQFLISCGIPPEAIRFRQHREKEMAHYAKDCWDAEIECSYGWVEVAGHSDRSCYDLTNHANYTKTDITAAKPLPAPLLVKHLLLKMDKKAIGMEFKKNSKLVCGVLGDMGEEEKTILRENLESKGEVEISCEGVEVKLSSKHISFEEVEKTVMEERYIPHVIEPSFGVERILYTVLEHAFRVREIEASRTYFVFPPLIAPFKCSILPLINHPDIMARVPLLSSNRVDDSSQTIGRRYARTDELGIPFAITIDDITLKDDTVTLREINSMKQIRLPLSELAKNLNLMNLNIKTWEDIIKEFPAFIHDELKEKAEEVKV